MSKVIGQVNMGYGGVEIKEDCLNIITKKCKIKNDYGYQIKEEKNKIKQMENLSHMTRFLQDSMVPSVYVEPLQFKVFTGGVYEVMFLVDNQYCLNVLMMEDGVMLPALFYTSENGEHRLLKFSYEGDALEWFFGEIKKDILKIISDNARSNSKITI